MRFARYFSVLLTIAALTALTGCGSQGNPLPPSLELPKPVSDLKAVRKGDRVLLAWTAPRETTDKLHIKEAGKTRVCRSTALPAAMECTELAPLPAAPAPGAANYIDTLPQELQERSSTQFAVYTVEAMNTRGRSADLSNAVKVTLAATLPPPADLQARITAGGIALSFTGPVTPPAMARGERTYLLRVYRRAAGAVADTVAGEVQYWPAPAGFLDKNFEWEKSYQYRITTVTRISPPGETPVEVEGDDSSPVEVLAHDSFPPAAPAAVEAVASSGGGQSFIDLTWSLNNEADLAGYNVYRREADAQPQKVNGDLVKTPAFRDANVTAGHTYLYTVSAVDLRANESGRSEETSETVPQP
jgi:predicted small lipoprotein YifL